MQFRELSFSELNEGYTLLSTLRIELTSDQFETFITAHYPKDYRPIGAYERGELRIYAGISIRENIEFGRHLIVDDFVACAGYEYLSREMVDYLGDYAKTYQCKYLFFFGQHQGLNIGDLREFRPKRDGFIRML